MATSLENINSYLANDPSIEASTKRTLQKCFTSVTSSPGFTGSPTVPTPPFNDNSTLIANTEFVQEMLFAGDPGIITPTDGQNLTIGNSGFFNPINNLIVSPAGPLNALTLNFGPGSQGGILQIVTFTQDITSLTLGSTNVPQTAGLDVPASITAGNCFGFVWDSTNKWVRFL